MKKKYKIKYVKKTYLYYIYDIRNNVVVAGFDNIDLAKQMLEKLETQGM